MNSINFSDSVCGFDMKVKLLYFYLFMEYVIQERSILFYIVLFLNKCKALAFFYELKIRILMLIIKKFLYGCKS